MCRRGVRARGPPLGALSLECFNLRNALQRVERALDEEDHSSARRQLEEAELILAGIDAARGRAATMVATLDRSTSPLEPEESR